MLFLDEPTSGPLVCSFKHLMTPLDPDFSLYHNKTPAGPAVVEIMLDCGTGHKVANIIPYGSL